MDVNKVLNYTCTNNCPADFCNLGENMQTKISNFNKTDCFLFL